MLQAYFFYGASQYKRTRAMTELQEVQPFTPVFIIVHDRVACLRTSLASYRTCIKAPLRFVFHDVASTYEPCLAFLQRMRDEGHEVYRSEVNNHLTVVDTIRAYLAQHPEIEYYVLTDPDVALYRHTRGDVLDFYLHLARLHPTRCIGPMLHIDDLPDHYPRKHAVMRRHMDQFWGRADSVEHVPFRGRTHAVMRVPLDTTFQFCHRSLPMRFPRAGIRCLPPYSAKHLDWYLNPAKLTPDQVYYDRHASRAIAHWGHGVQGVRVVPPAEKSQTAQWEARIRREFSLK